MLRPLQPRVTADSLEIVRDRVAAKTLYAHVLAERQLATWFATTVSDANPQSQNLVDHLSTDKTWLQLVKPWSRAVENVREVQNDCALTQAATTVSGKGVSLGFMARLLSRVSPLDVLLPPPSHALLR